MKKFFTIALASLATLFTITLASSFIAANAENSICIESVDGTPLGISLGAAQVRGLHDVLPEQYRTMFDASYGRFRGKALDNGYGTTIFVDGLKMQCSQSEEGDVYSISGNFDRLGYHKVIVRVGSRDNFISWMDAIALE